jgi:DNA-binding NarL/FixJ family response regulator
MIRVLLVNEYRLMCNVVASVLEDEEDIQVVGSATSYEQASQFVREEDIDVVLASTRLPERGALRLTDFVKGHFPEVNVLVLGITEHKEHVLQFIEAGADGYVLRDDSTDDLLESIRAADQGEAHVSPGIAAAMMDRLSELAQMFAHLETGVVESAGLTEREKQVLDLLGENFTNKEIADRLYIEVGTVKNHVHSILDKLDVNNREEAASYLAIIKR